MSKISDLTALTGAGVDTAADLVPVVDMSETGVARNKKMTLAEFFAGLAELADDRVAALLEAGTNVTLTYDDVAGTLTIDAATPSTGDISGFNEAVDDRVAALLQAGSGVVIAYNDTAGTLTLTAAAAAPDNDTALGSDSTTLPPSVHAAKAYIDAKVAGLSWKQAVRAATTINHTLATGYANGQVIDGVTLSTGDRVLIKNQTTASENGIYVVPASGAPSRATDADSGAELVNASVYVSEGTTNADTQWTCTTNAPITPGTTTLAFAQINTSGNSYASAADIQAGTNSTKVIAPDQLVAAAAPQTLTDGATISWDMAAGFNAKVTIAGNRTLATPTNPKVGLTYSLAVIQDGTGSRTMTWPASFDWGTTGAPTLTTTASKRDRITLFCTDAATPKFDAFLSGKGFS
jgi:hypothetical protein